MDGDDFFTDQQSKFDDDFEEQIYDEDSYNLLNDETFGNDMSVGDWEIDHENFATFDENIKHNKEMEMNDKILSKTNVFNASQKLLPDLKKEIRLSTNQYPIPNIFNMPPGFNETNESIDNFISNQLSTELISSAVSVADLERQLINAVKISPSYNDPITEIQDVSSLYKNDFTQYNPYMQAIPKNFPGNNTPRNQMNIDTFNYMNNLLEQSDYIDHDAGFMTVREKHWLAGIQTIQFHSNNALEEDFYFTMFQKRHYLTNKSKTHVFSSTQKNDSQAKTNNSYTQLHFENSLGKVLIGNVITPKKTIDIERNDFTKTANRSIVSHKNSRQILLEIEHIYVPLLQIEQTYYSVRNRIQAAPIVQSYIDELTRILQNHSHHIEAYVIIRKGKKLIHRILPHIKNANFLWIEFFGPSICSIIAKDTSDQLLLLFLPYIRPWILCLCLGDLIQIAEYLMKNLSFVLISIFGISIIANMIERAEEVRLITEQKLLKQWSLFISNVIYVGSETIIQKPVIGLDRKIIDRHLSHLLLDKSITSEKKNFFVQKLSFIASPVKKRN